MMLIGLVTLFPPLMMACSGSQTSVDVGVRVDLSSCREDRAAPLDRDFAELDCTQIGGKGTVHVQFPRKEWNELQARHLGAIDGGSWPGK